MNKSLLFCGMLLGIVLAGCCQSPDVELVQTAQSLDHLSSDLLSPTRSVVLGTTSPRKKFFSDIMGMAEKEYQSLSSDTVAAFLNKGLYKGRPVYFLCNQKKQCFQAGYFQEYSIQELRELAQAKMKQRGKAQTAGTLTIIGEESYKPSIDIGYMQAQQENNGACFQAASNFNALEFVSPSQIPENGIKGYIYDNTQGPRAAISAAPGIIYRQYYIFNQSEKNPLLWRQTEQHQIELLSDLPEIYVQNSYVLFGKSKLAELSKISFDDIIKRIKIGYHRDVQVTFGQGSEPQVVVQRNDQIIDQVYTAAIDMMKNSAFFSNPTAVMVAKAMQHAACEGTLKAAYIHDCKKVVLTLVGLGVFQNDPEWLYEALESQCEFIKQSGLEVVVNTFTLKSDPIEEKRLLYGKLQALAENL